MTEQFYYNIAAAGQSMTAYAEREVTDFPGWVMNHLQPQVGDNILNAGCGNGKHTLAVARMVGDTGNILTVDRSYRMLNTLSQSSQQQGLEHRIRFLYLNLDEMQGHLRLDDFDRALSANSLSQVKYPQSAFHAIYQALKPGGLFFFYGPARKDLAELRLFIAALADRTPVQEGRDLLFMEKIALPHVQDIFPRVEVVQFENPLRFDSPEELFDRWYESALYEETLELAFRQAAVRHFQTHHVFETAQRVIGVKAVKL